MGYVATIGMFDGVHLGHQFVLHHVVETAREQGLQSMAITFDQTMHRDQVLTPLDAKRLLLSKTGFVSAKNKLSAFDLHRPCIRF